MKSWIHFVLLYDRVAPRVRGPRAKSYRRATSLARQATMSRACKEILGGPAA